MADKSLTAINSRNYNPGNLRPSSKYTWNGEVGQNGGFVVFDSPEMGTRALAKNLYTSQETHGNNSVRDIITRWAPPSENNTEAYVQKVAKEMGVNPDANLGSLRDNPATTKALVKSITKHEGGGLGIYNDKHFEDGIALANGKSAAEIDFQRKPENFEPPADANDGFAENEDGDLVPQTTVPTKPEIAKKQIENIVTSNWMSTVDSPQYIWTLFLVDNETFNDPNSLHGSESAVSAGKAVIVARQGVTTQFSLDNFAMIATVTPGQAHGNSTPGIIQFDIIETLGFTFLDRIIKAGIGLGKPGNLHEQNFVLKLDFVGRDPLTAASVKYPGTFIYPVKLNQIRSTTGPEGTRYNVIAWSLIKHAQTETVTDVDVTVKNVTTVKEFIDGFVTKYNSQQMEMLSPVDQKNGKTPDKQIEINFDESSNVRGIKGLMNFNLAVKPWGATANADKAGGQAKNLDNADANDITIEAETSIPVAIGNKVQLNTPAFAEYVKEAQKIGMTPSIVVDSKPVYPDNFAGTGTGADAYVGPIKIIYTIKIHQHWAAQNGDKATHRKNFADTKFQTEKFKMLPIEKNYTFLYTGLNTEVLNYQIDIESLYTVVSVPQAGIYHADKSEQFTPTTPTKITKYLEDVQYDKMPSNYNDYTKFINKPYSIGEQQKNETDATDTLNASLAANMAKREYDSYNFSMEIKGDPYWMAGSLQSIVEGADSPDYSKRDALVSFLQYNPNAEDLLEFQRRGPVDLVSSGIYKLTKIESRFQGGKFTQTLSGFKDPTTNTLLILPQLIEISGA
jgi:hypothetical protein